MTTAVIIGYVSLFAVAIQTGIIMIEFIREALAHRAENAILHGRRRRGLRGAAAAEADDGGHDGSRVAADHAVERIGDGHRQADRDADLRRDDQLDDLRALLIPCLFAIGEDIRRRWPERFPVRHAPHGWQESHWYERSSCWDFASPLLH